MSTKIARLRVSRRAAATITHDAADSTGPSGSDPDQSPSTASTAPVAATAGAITGASAAVPATLGTRLTMVGAAGIASNAMEAAGRIRRSSTTSVGTRTGGSTASAGSAEVNRSDSTRRLVGSLSESFLTAGPRAPFTPPDSRPPEEAS